MNTELTVQQRVQMHLDKLERICAQRTQELAEIEAELQRLQTLQSQYQIISAKLRMGNATRVWLTEMLLGHMEGGDATGFLSEMLNMPIMRELGFTLDDEEPIETNQAATSIATTGLTPFQVAQRCLEAIWEDNTWKKWRSLNRLVAQLYGPDWATVQVATPNGHVTLGDDLKHADGVTYTEIERLFELYHQYHESGGKTHLKQEEENLLANTGITSTKQRSYAYFRKGIQEENESKKQN